MIDRSEQSPLERRVAALRDSGLSEAAIAVKFRRSPRFIRQVVSMSEMRKQLGVSGSPVPETSRRSGMSPRQRLVVKWRERGASYAEIASRMRRSPSYVRQIEAIARSRAG